MSPSIRLPPPLRRGDRVRCVAPSGPFERERFAAGVALLEESGLVPLYDDGLMARCRYLAGDDARRLGELCTAIADVEARAIWIARGGYGATRLLPALDVEAVRQAGKWLVGFSDATSLHALWRRAGLASLHGPNLTTIAGWGAEPRRQTWSWLFSPARQELCGRLVANAGAARGTLFGGNLTVLAAMTGTGALPSLAGCIVLLEDIGEKPYRLDRSLTQLIQGGAFAGAAGFVIGQLTDCKDSEGNDPLEVVAELLAPLGVPVLGGVPIGHEPSSYPALLGAVARIEASGTLTLDPP